MSSNLTDALARFLADLPGRLEALRRDLVEVDASLLPLDLSFESLDRLEDYYRRVLEGERSPATLDEVRARVAAYVGATLIDRVGGKWVMHTELGRPEPGVIGIPKAKKGIFDPLSPVRDYARLQRPGFLRDSTERWDLAMRRETLCRQIDQIDSELEELRRGVSALVGHDVDVLDGSEASLAHVEEALKKLRDGPAPRETTRRVRLGVVLLLGTCLQRALGRGEWSVVDDPKNADFGHASILHWAPYPTVASVGPRSRASFLYSVLTAKVASRRTA